MDSRHQEDTKHIFGFQELVGGEALSAIQTMQRLIETQVTDEDTLKRRLAYLLTYATYSFSSVSLSDVIRIFDTTSPYVESVMSLNLIKERIASRIRFENNIAKQTANSVKNQYATAMQCKSRDVAPEVYCISIDRLRERQLRFHTNLSQLGCSTVEYRGVDSKSLDRIPSFIQGPITRNEAACVLSHKAVWTEIQQKGLAFTFVFEDDSIVTDLPEVESMLEDGSKIDVVFLNNCLSPEYTLVPTDFHIRSAASYLLPIRDGCGTYGYFVTYRGAQKLLELFETVVAPVDIQILAHSDATIPVNDRLQSCQDRRRTKLRLSAKRVYPFVADHPPANYSSIAGRYRRAYCPGLWHGDMDR